MAAPEKTVLEMTRGTSGTVLMRWPRARRRAGTLEAAMAEAVAKRLEPSVFGAGGGEGGAYFWLRLIF
jgi:hypothetical protein